MLNVLFSAVKSIFCEIEKNEIVKKIKNVSGFVKYLRYIIECQKSGLY